MTDTFIDARDGKTYKQITIGTQIWMAENLNYIGDGSIGVYNPSDPSGATYGRYYTWNEIMAGGSTLDTAFRRTYGMKRG